MEPAPSNEQSKAGTSWSTEVLRLIFGLALAHGANGFSAFAVATLLPRTTADLGGLDAYGWAFSAYMLASIVGLTLASGECDRRGPRIPYSAGLLCFGMGLLLASIAPTMTVFILARVIQGFGGGLFGSPIFVAVGRRFSDDERPRVLAILSTAGIVPALVGPALAGVISDIANWQVGVLVILPLPLLSALFAWPGLRAIDRPVDQSDRDWSRLRHAFLLAVGSALLLTGLGSSRIVIAAPAVIIGAIFVARMMRTIMPAGTLRLTPGLPAAVGLMMILSLVYFGVDAFVPLLLTDIRGRSASFAGLALTAAAISWTGGT